MKIRAGVLPGFAMGDVAAKYPLKLAGLKKLWWTEAARNGALPLLEAPAGRTATYDQALTGQALAQPVKSPVAR